MNVHFVTIQYGELKVFRVLYLQTNSDFQKIITQTRKHIFHAVSYILCTSTRYFEINYLIFGPPLCGLNLMYFSLAPAVTSRILPWTISVFSLGVVSVRSPPLRESGTEYVLIAGESEWLVEGVAGVTRDDCSVLIRGVTSILLTSSVGTIGRGVAGAETL